jgi:hypothetical protein
MADPNIEILAKVANALGELRARMTFVGGCATGLLITDPGASPVRATQDVKTFSTRCRASSSKAAPRRARLSCCSA